MTFYVLVDRKGWPHGAFKRREAAEIYLTELRAEGDTDVHIVVANTQVNN